MNMPIQLPMQPTVKALCVRLLVHVKHSLAFITEHTLLVFYLEECNITFVEYLYYPYML